MLIDPQSFHVFCKEDGSALRERISVHKLVGKGLSDSDGAGLATDKYVMRLDGKPIGNMHVRSDGSVLKSAILDEYRGLGLGRKMYGEVGRMLPEGVTLKSDVIHVSGAATKLWDDMADRSTGGLHAKRNPLFQRVLHARDGTDTSMLPGAAPMAEYKPVSPMAVRESGKRSAFELHVPEAARRPTATVAPAKRAPTASPVPQISHAPAAPVHTPPPAAPVHTPPPAAPVHTPPPAAPVHTPPPARAVPAVHVPTAGTAAPVKGPLSRMLAHVTPGRAAAGVGVLAAGGLLAHHLYKKSRGAPNA